MMRTYLQIEHPDTRFTFSGFASYRLRGRLLEIDGIQVESLRLPNGAEFVAVGLNSIDGAGEWVRENLYEEICDELWRQIEAAERDGAATEAERRMEETNLSR